MNRFNVLFLGCLMALSPVAQPLSGCDSLLYLRNQTSLLGIQAWGGAITDFRLQGSRINPFSWKSYANELPPNNQKGAPFHGHFLCLGRWGTPTEGEINAGVPHNGQSGNACWQIRSRSATYLHMQSEAPLDGVAVERHVWMDPVEPVFKVTETVSSRIPFARLFNVVQHATIGTPFLDTSTIVDCNAGRGFLQALCYPNPNAYAFTWPMGVRDTLRTPLNLRSSNEPFSYVATHIFNDTLGWVTALHPGKRLLMGYVWKTAEYPWINVWQQWRGDSLWAKGLEFGTTGIGKSYQDLLAIDSRFQGVPSFFLLDAGDRVSKSYLCFSAAIPEGFRGVASVILKKGSLQIIENAPRGRVVNIPVNISF